NAEAFRNLRHAFADSSQPLGYGTVAGTRAVPAQCFSSRRLRQRLRQQHDGEEPRVNVSTTESHELSGKSALRNIELEIPMSPVKGSSSSKIRKIALANDSAHTNSEIMTTTFVRTKRVALTKIALSQNTTMTRKGVGIELPTCVNNRNRICAP